MRELTPTEMGAGSRRLGTASALALQWRRSIALGL
jgi:hypothetical protein